MSTQSQGQRIISDEGFIDSIRDFGLTTRDAVKELVDNSFDANAENIWISIGRDDDDGRLYLIVEDDGDGIPFERLAEVLAFGGRLPWREDTTGKYGFGLPASAFCQSSRTEVYSKTEDDSGNKFNFNAIDVDLLKDSDGILPDNTKRELPDDYNFQMDSTIESGTAVILTNLIRPEYITVDGLSSNISDDLAEFHRVFLVRGKNIIVNGEELQPKDPLMKIDGSDAVKECGKSVQYGKIEPIEYPELADGGDIPKVEVEIRKLPIKKIIEKELESEYAIGQEKQGFYIIRKNRQIAGGRSLHLFTKHSRYNYFRGEIRFPPELDDYFGVQTNKSRFSLDPDLRSKLEKRISGVLTELGDDILEERNNARKEKQKKKAGEQTTSERIANKTLPRLPSSGHTPDDAEKEEQEQDLEEEIQEVKDRPDLTEEEKIDLIDSLRERFDDQEYINRKIEVLGSGHFYEMTHKGSQIDVSINEAHNFYKYIYKRAMEDDSNLHVYLDLLVYTLAKTEDQFYDQEQVLKFYDEQRHHWSHIMNSFLNEAQAELED